MKKCNHHLCGGGCFCFKYGWDRNAEIREDVGITKERQMNVIYEVLRGKHQEFYKPKF